ncbi:unnamed protein product, partial [Callosobruchus maculatus]
AIPLLLYILLKLWLKRRRTYWERKGLPVITLPPATVRQHSAVTTLKQYRKAKEMGLKHVGVYGHFNKPTYLPIDLEIMKHIAVKDFAYFQNHGVYVNERDDPISAGLFHLEDERWKSMRAKLTATFTSGKMKMMFPIVTKCAAGLKDILEDHAKIGDPIDIKDTLARFTTDVIGECAFGIECNCIKDPNTEFRKFGKKQFDFSTWQRRIRGMLTAAFPHSVLKFFRFKFIDPEVETFFKDLVQRMVEYREVEKERRNDFLQLLIDLKNTGKVSDDDGTLGNPVKVGDTQHITMDQITAQCLIFFNAGFETSSSTMTFALYELATHPEYQDNLRDEIKTILKKHDGKVTYEAVMEMDYLEKVINDFTLEAGTNVVFTMQPIHMDPEYYPNPEEFNPDNFSEENKAKRPPFTFMPFGEGPRICIGLRFGKMQTKVGLITVLNNYKVTLNKKTIYPIEYDPFSPILSIKGFKETDSILTVSTMIQPVINIAAHISFTMHTMYLAYALVGLAVTFYLYVKWAHSYWKRKGVNYLEPEFLYGNSKKIMKREISFGDRFAEMYTEMKSKGWKFGGTYILIRPSFLPIDLELTKCILQKDFTYFMNHGFYVNEEADPLTGHLFNLENQKWKNIRAKLTPTFTSGKLKMMFQTMAACTESLAEVLREYEKINDAVDIKEVLARFTTDVIGSVAFGLECNSLKDPNSTFRKYGKKVFEPSFTRRIKMWVMLFTPRDILKKFGFRSTDADVERFFLGTVKDTIRYREQNNVFRKDFMHLLIQLKNRGEVSEDDKLSVEKGESQEGKHLSENEIAAQCFVFFLAGFETSATTMTFALYELAANQDIQDKLREEVRNVLDKYDGKMTYEAIMEMTYLDKIVHETLRKHPPVPGTPRVCTKRYQIPGTGIFIEEGTRVNIPIHAIHRDPEYYPDPEKFDPERFNEENKSKRHPYAFMPFGEGPRICIGARFGLLQAKVGLTAIISKFIVTIDKKTQLPLKYETNMFITTPKGEGYLLSAVCIATFCIFEVIDYVLRILLINDAFCFFVVYLSLSSVMDLVTCIYILASVPIIFYFYILWAHSYWKRNGIHQLEPKFFYGHVEKLLKKQLSMGDQFQILYNKIKSNGWKYGGIYFLTLPSFVVTDLDLIKHILQNDFTHFMNHGAYVNEKADPLTGNLFNLEDARWRSIRVKLTPTFTSGKLKMMFQTMVACTDGLEDLLLETEKKDGVIDIKDVLARFTTDVVGSVGFGIECSSLKDPDSEFRKYGRKLFEDQTFLRRMQQLIAFVAPKWFLEKINFKQTDPDIERFFLTLVKDTIRYREKNNISRKDFMHLLLQLKNRGSVAEDDEVIENKEEVQKGTFLTDTQIAAQCFVFFIAGFETSATAMLFALYELAVNQDIQKRLRRHCNEVLDRHGNQITYEAIMEMTYLDKVIFETLRKHSPVAGIPRVCTKDYPIPGTDEVLKKGTVVHIPIHAIQMDPDYYPNPEKFDPERFSDENKSARFAMLQAKVGLLSIIRRFRVTLNKKTMTPLEHETLFFVTAPKGGIWLNVEEIN